MTTYRRIELPFIKWSKQKTAREGGYQAAVSGSAPSLADSAKSASS
jgi:hypothetical protein